MAGVVLAEAPSSSVVGLCGLALWNDDAPAKPLFFQIGRNGGGNGPASGKQRSEGFTKCESRFGSAATTELAPFDNICESVGACGKRARAAGQGRRGGAARIDAFARESISVGRRQISMHGPTVWVNARVARPNNRGALAFGRVWSVEHEFRPAPLCEAIGRRRK